MKLLIIIGLFLNMVIYSNPKEEIKYDILYFHATIRCNECLTIEEFTKNTLNSAYEKELKSKEFSFTSLDFLEPENEHFQTDYSFDNQTLIISKKVNGKEVKWKNLDKVWNKLKNYNDFKEYLVSEISEFKK